ncbi:MAG: GTPase HflX [Thermodesulforhabdaceae bacterium]
MNILPQGGGSGIRKVYGNTSGLKSSVLNRIQNLYRRRVPPQQVISPEICRDIARLSFEISRQIGLLIARDGSIEMVIVGNARSLFIPELPKSREARKRLRGLRLVHTHFNNEPLTQDDLMDLAFLRLDCVAAVGVDRHGGAEQLFVAHIFPGGNTEEDTSRAWTILPPTHYTSPNIDFLELVRSLEEELERVRTSRLSSIKSEDQAVLVVVADRESTDVRETIEEMKELARASEIAIVDTVVQKVKEINPKYFIGKGKLTEVMLTALRHGVDLLIFDRELNPSQVRALTDATELRVIDRTQLILDIFARRAQSREGKIQVEMAQLRYLMPRLNVKDDALSRLAGGIGTRGPGETKLEIDRRRIKKRLDHLERELAEIRKSRSERRRKRQKLGFPVISLIGYTNAGKSTLLNALTKSNAVVMDQFFATLDPLSKRLRFPRDFEVIVTDTVGFISNLPDELLDAFAATLEELQDADILVHVVDISNPRFENHITAVEKILQKLQLDNKPRILVFNKIDMLPSHQAMMLAERYGAIPISAIERSTLHPLIRALEDHVEELLTTWNEASLGS